MSNQCKHSFKPVIKSGISLTEMFDILEETPMFAYKSTQEWLKPQTNPQVLGTVCSKCGLFREASQ